MSVYDEIRDERLTHAARGYDEEHDREHGVSHLVGWAMFYASKGDRRDLIKGASLLVAAIEAQDSEGSA